MGLYLQYFRDSLTIVEEFDINPLAESLVRVVDLIDEMDSFLEAHPCKPEYLSIVAWLSRFTDGRPQKGGLCVCTQSKRNQWIKDRIRGRFDVGYLPPKPEFIKFEILYALKWVEFCEMVKQARPYTPWNENFYTQREQYL